MGIRDAHTGLRLTFALSCAVIRFPFSHPYGFASSWQILQRVPDTLMLRLALLVTAPIVRCVSLDACMAHGPACAFHSPGMFHRLVNVRYSFARHGGRVSNTLAGPSLCVLLASRAIA
jgi:hypothetical protein